MCRCLMIALAFALALSGRSPVHGDDVAPATIRLADCRIKPADQVTLSANQNGVLNLVPQEGQVVEMGQKLIQLEDDLARVALQAAEKEAANDVDVRHAEAASAVARLEYEQKLEVNERSKGAVSISELRRTKLEMDRTVLQIEQARHKRVLAVMKRNEAVAQLRTYSVQAPVAGTVNKVLRHKGETVRQGDPVVELVNTRRVRVEGFLDVTERPRVTAGTVVHVQLGATAGKPVSPAMPGRIVFVDSVVQPVTQQVRIWADVENTNETLLPGLKAVMTIVPAEASVAAKGR